MSLPPEDQEPVIVVGAGAAGLMAAIFAAQGARPVFVLEGTQRPGQKIIISGGGRCNVLPSHAAAEDFVTDGSPHTLAKIFRAWPLDDVRRFFEADLGVPLQLEPETGKLFPVANKARSVLDALLTAVHRTGGRIRLGARATGVERSKACWLVYLSTGETVKAAAVILATGGLSVPATGSDGAGLAIARSLGHSLVPTYPALVPLTTSRPDHRALAGISLTVTLTTPVPGSNRSVTSRGGFLFTHRGYSGPALLNVAHMAVRSTLLGGPRARIFVQWTDLGATAWDALLRSRRGPLLPLLRDLLPERLAAQLLAEAGVAGVEGSQLRREDRMQIVENLTHYELPWDGHEGYRTAEVTGGGVPLNEVDPATMASRVAPGVYLCGEMLDAFGPIGGYNFLWGWITGRLAGLGSQAQ